MSDPKPEEGAPMKRREFITLLCGAVASPLAARAQPPTKLPTIGFLGTTTLSAMSEWVAAFVQRLRELGWIEGRNIAIEYRWAEARSERYGVIAAELVQSKVDVIVTTAPAFPAVQRATSVIPIVFALDRARNSPIGGHGQSRFSRRRARGQRGSRSGQRAWSGGG